MSAVKSKRHERRRAREDALSLLYSSDITEQPADNVVDEGNFPEDIELGEYAEALVRGIAENADDIDARLAATSENWSVDRMPVVDRALLRLAVYEMVYVDEVPVSVAINEAVELAKAYGGEDESPRFVNGVLGRIARALDNSGAAEEKTEEAAEAEADEVEEAEIAEAVEAAEAVEFAEEAEADED